MKDTNSTITTPKGVKETAAQPARKTLVLVGGDKGGVGKSTVARTLAEWYTAQKCGLKTYDGDDTNPTFSRFVPSAQRLITKIAKGFEPLAFAIDEPEQVHLVDLGAGTSLVFNQFASKGDFFGFVADAGARITLVFCLVPSVDSIALIQQISELHGNKLNYVIVKNNAIPGSWNLWEQSKTRARVMGELRGLELEMDSLDGDTYSIVDRECLTWEAATTSTALPSWYRSLVKTWRAGMFAQFDKAKGLLV